MISVQPMLDLSSLRLVRQFQSQLTGAAVSLVLSGTPGAGVSTLLQVLAGHLGPVPVRVTSPRARFREAVTAQAGQGMGAGLLPVALVDLGRTPSPEVLAQRAELNAAQELEVQLLVLSADRLKGAIDLSLVRLLRAQTAQPLVLFINRVDCLENPAKDIPAIRARLESAIERHTGAMRPQIVFGSLSWAEAALKDRLAALGEDSKETLLQLAEVADVDGDDHAPSFVWKLSGMPQLVDALGKVMAASPLRRMVGKVRRQFRAILDNIGHEGEDRTAEQIAACQLSADEVTERAEKLGQRLASELKRQAQQNADQFRQRLARLGQQFIETAVSDLNRRIDKAEEITNLEIDTFRLRLQLRSACLGFAQNCRSLSDRTLRRAAREFSQISREVLGSETRMVQAESNLGTFISVRSAEARATGLDLGAATWSWKPMPGQNRATLLRDFRVKLQARVTLLAQDTLDRQTAAPMDAMRDRLTEFVDGQTRMLVALASTQIVPRVRAAETGAAMLQPFPVEPKDEA
ncbi:hypothetical protein [Neogemmobacter tilapiae]|uniref:Uncharacterized protein n=1 Tax=Neogemmobacter tilapiae TaxID=875041 RepID=A0A918TX31_9RHOB|nr:hypothetical protein [Gemmobacter tilapiae]GHC66752.1 hypothetical protein GCM10007315_34570 [Gemmobacter tilapiae]